MQEFNMKIIAKIKSPYTDKFGIPRQSGMAGSLPAQIIFEPEYRNADALRGIDGFSHIWILWQFSKAVRDTWSPTVRPPRLGGNTRIGVFATRSPFRPNSIGLSSVKLDRIEHTKEFGTILHVSGADMLDGTPIFDIKPYLAYTDSHPDAIGGFTASYEGYKLNVLADNELLAKLPDNLRAGIIGMLEADPRPSYQDDKDRIYGMTVAGFEIKFTVDGETLTVKSIEKSM